MIGSIFYNPRPSSLKYSIMIQLPSNICIPSRTAESLLQRVQPWESKTHFPKCLRRISFTIILKGVLDLKIQAYPAWASVCPCSPFHHKHQILPTVTIFSPTALSLLSCSFFSTPVPSHNCYSTVFFLPYIIWFHSLWKKYTFFYFTAQTSGIIIQEIPPARHTLFTTWIRSTPFITLQTTTLCYFAFLKAINPLI